MAMVLMLAAAVAAVLWAYREPLDGYGSIGTAFGARTACSCRYVAGRELSDCKKDFEPGMAAVFLRDDPENKAVTAYIPLLASQTAHFREGYGCLLDAWEG